MLLHMCVTKQLKITHKYLERGHTQMECDSVHSTVERQLGRKPIHCPATYVEEIRSARRCQPYTVKYVRHEFFNDYSNLRYHSSIRPGCKTADPVVTDLLQMIYLPDGSVRYKLSHTGQELLLPCSARLPGPRVLGRRYTAPLKISKAKFKHLQELKRVIPVDYHTFYDSLPHEI